MQPSITKFFKALQPEKQAKSDDVGEQSAKKETDIEKPVKQAESVDTGKQYPEKEADFEKPVKQVESVDAGDQSPKKETDIKKPPSTENTPKKGSQASAKRMAEEEDIKTPSKRLAMSPDSTTDKDDKLGGSAMTPIRKPASQGDIVKTCPSPLMDINVLIRKKISCGAHALHENIGVSWFRALQGEFDKPYFKKLSNFVQQERSTKIVYPPENKVYAWTHHHDIKDTRVMILGQDPYHGPGQAHGLCFSVTRGVRVPPSLLNIYKELADDIPGFVPPSSGDLTGWAKQGVLLLNTCLSVNQGQANSHQNKGWETFTDAVISWISKNMKHKIVFLLWGRPAQKKSTMIDKRHKVLTSAHPSPLSAHNGFIGCRHFSQTNSFLQQQDLAEIDWRAL